MTDLADLPHYIRVDILHPLTRALSKVDREELVKKLLVPALAVASVAGLYFGYGTYERSKAVAACNSLAAHPNDATRPSGVSGVAIEKIEWSVAVPACLKAAKLSPDSARIRYQTGRALQAAKQHAEALAAYKEAVLLGSSRAAYNAGTIYLGMGSVQRDAASALTYFESAATENVEDSRRIAAEILESGESMPAPDLERAATHRRALSDRGDAFSSEWLFSALSNRKIQPTSAGEQEQRMIDAADKGRIYPAVSYGRQLLERGTEESVALGANYALTAFRAAVGAPLNTENGWLVHQWSAFQLYRELVSKGAPNQMTAEEFSKATADFPATARKFRFTVDCNGTKTPFDVFVWQWTRSYSQSDPQFKWLKEARGCDAPEGEVSSMRRLFAIAKENKVSYPDLVYYAYVEAPEKEKADAEARKLAEQAAEQQASAATGQDTQGPSSGQVIGTAIVAGIGALACWYWSDQCKELAWEATKSTARELGSQAAKGGGK